MDSPEAEFNFNYCMQNKFSCSGNLYKLQINLLNMCENKE